VVGVPHFATRQLVLRLFPVVCPSSLTLRMGVPSWWVRCVLLTYSTPQVLLNIFVTPPCLIPLKPFPIFRLFRTPANQIEHLGSSWPYLLSLFLFLVPGVSFFSWRFPGQPTFSMDSTADWRCRPFPRLSSPPPPPAGGIFFFHPNSRFRLQGITGVFALCVNQMQHLQLLVLFLPPL